MSRRRARGSRVDGVLLLNKPAGITSQTAVSRVKALYGAAKAGHTGTLDPAAEGLLPVCLGEATKFSQGLLDADKGYRAVVRLGVMTTTGDLEGEVLREQPVALGADQVAGVLGRFRGEIQQTPPMYSAVKRDGRPLYAYARAGHEIERDARAVRISSLELLGSDGRDVTLDVRCSKGTYIRVLAEDIGEALGCGACLAHLTRVKVGAFGVDEAVALADLHNMDQAQRLHALLPVDALVATLPRLELTAAEASRLGVGTPVVRAAGGPEGVCRAYGPEGRFLGLVTCGADGRVFPRRLVSSGPAGTTAGAQDPRNA